MVGKLGAPKPLAEYVLGLTANTSCNVVILSCSINSLEIGVTARAISFSAILSPNGPLTEAFLTDNPCELLTCPSTSITSTDSVFFSTAALATTEIENPVIIDKVRYESFKCYSLHLAILLIVY